MFWSKIKYPNVAIGKTELVQLMRACYLPNLIMDADYTAVDHHFIERLNKEYLAGLWRWGLKEWSPRWDCDDFALTYLMTAKKLYAKHPTECESVAVGMIAYRAKVASNHAINFYITADRVIHFIEPQYVRNISNGEIEFSETDWDSIKFIIC